MEAVIFYTYILYSDKKDKFYVGYTSDIDKRLDKHNSGSSRSTKDGIPWKLVYFEEFETKSEAIKREIQIKRMKSRKYIESLIVNSRRSSRRVGKSRRSRHNLADEVRLGIWRQ